MPNNMERFTYYARHVLMLAQVAAEQLQHNYIGTEHILLGLLREEGSVAQRVLRELGVDQDNVEELVKRMSQAGQRLSNARPDLTPESKKLLEWAVDEARLMKQQYAGTDHLLLGLTRLKADITLDILDQLGVKPEIIRAQIQRLPQTERQESVDPVPTIRGTGKLAIKQFAPTVQSAIKLALEEAQRLGSNELGAEHLLLGLLLAAPNGVLDILKQMNIDPEALRRETLKALESPGDDA